MNTGRPFLLGILLLTAALAGCASQTPRGAGSPGEEAGEPPSTDDEGTAGTSAEAWHAYAIDREVPDKGTFTGYGYTHQEEIGDGIQRWSIDGTYEGVVTKDIRVKRQALDPETYEMSDQTVTVGMNVRGLDHTIEVLEDTTGASEAGSTVSVATYIPADELETSGSFGWVFVKMDVEREDGSSRWEYVLTDEMQGEMQSGSTFFLP